MADTIATSPQLLVLFGASWCEPVSPLKAELEKLTADTDTRFLYVDAEEPGIAEKFDITKVPVVSLFANGTQKDRIFGADMAAIRKSMSEHFAGGAHQSLEDRIRAILSSAPIMLLMKGTPEEPRCKFSRAMVELLGRTGFPPGSYGAFNILSDEEVRQGVKPLVQFHTFPQLYVKGELVGGIDIANELAESDELRGVLAA